MTFLVSWYFLTWRSDLLEKVSILRASSSLRTPESVRVDKPHLIPQSKSLIRSMVCTRCLLVFLFITLPRSLICSCIDIVNSSLFTESTRPTLVTHWTPALLIRLQQYKPREIQLIPDWGFSNRSPPTRLSLMEGSGGRTIEESGQDQDCFKCLCLQHGK